MIPPTFDEFIRTSQDSREDLLLGAAIATILTHPLYARTTAPGVYGILYTFASPIAPGKKRKRLPPPDDAGTEVLLRHACNLLSPMERFRGVSVDTILVILGDIVDRCGAKHG